VNDKNFPCPAGGASQCPGDGQPDGEDGVMAQSSAGPFSVPTASGTTTFPISSTSSRRREANISSRPRLRLYTISRRRSRRS